MTMKHIQAHHFQKQFCKANTSVVYFIRLLIYVLDLLNRST